MSTVRIPPDFAYYSDDILRDNGGAKAIWLIAVTEYLETRLLCVLVAARDGSVGALPWIPVWAAMSGVSLSDFHSALAVKSMILAFLKLSVVVASILSPH